VTEEKLLSELEATLNRFHVPLVKGPQRGPQFKDGVGGIMVLVSNDSYPGNGYVRTILQLRVEEKATLKRNPSLSVEAILWESEQEVNFPSDDSKNKFGEAIRTLAERLALAYLGAQKR
jgi:hypothetical protein